MKIQNSIVRLRKLYPALNKIKKKNKMYKQMINKFCTTLCSSNFPVPYLGFNVPRLRTNFRGFSTSGKEKPSNSFYLENFLLFESLVIDNFFENVQVIREKHPDFPYSEYF